MKTNLLLTAALLIVTSFAMAEAPEVEPDGVINEAFPEIMPFDPVADAVEPPTIVTLDRNDAFIEGLNVFELPMLTVDDIAEADRLADEKFAGITPGPLRVGVTRAFEPGEVAIHRGGANVIQTTDGQSVTTLAIRSPGAYGMRLHITDFDIGDGTAVVYSLTATDVVARGPYTSKGPKQRGDFWTASLPGEDAYIEIVGAEAPRLEVKEIVHFDHDFGDGRGSPPLLGCHEDVMCHLGLVDWIPVIATGQMNFSDADGSYVCTGTLLTDLDPETDVPWFITAKHCLDTQAMVDTLEVVWFYQTPVCDDEANVPNWWSLPRTIGGLHVRRYGENDMEFMRLSTPLPGGLGFAGWTEATSTGTYGVHHPKGSWKRMVDVSSATIGCGSFDPTDYDSYDRDNGLTQKGSSGSGVFNSSGQLSGQLYGVCSLTTDPDDLNCSNIDNFWNMYGEFDTSHDEIGWWLGLGGTMYVDPASGCMFEIGSEDCPFKTIENALAAAWPDLRIKIAAGDYPNLITFDQEVTLMANGGTVTIGASP